MADLLQDRHGKFFFFSRVEVDMFFEFFDAAGRKFASLGGQIFMGCFCAPEVALRPSTPFCAPRAFRTSHFCHPLSTNKKGLQGSKGKVKPITMIK